MQFKDREEAGHQLAEALAPHKGEAGLLVVALPRGGLVPGRIVADALEAPLDIVVPRKIGAPLNPEYAIGALTETGDVIWNEPLRAAVDAVDLAAIVAKEKAEAIRRLELYRRGMPPRDFKGKTVIVVDDGAATGYTMRAAVASVQRQMPGRVIVALPICSADVLEKLKSEADETIALVKPAVFGALGAFYASFPEVGDDEVIKLMHLPK